MISLVAKLQKGTLVGQKSSQQYGISTPSSLPEKSLNELLMGKILEPFERGVFSSLALVLGKKPEWFK